VKDQNSRPGSVDSDILQGKADVLKAVKALASQGSGPPSEKQNLNIGDNGPIQVQVKPVIAVRSQGERPGGSQQTDATKAGQAAATGHVVAASSAAARNAANDESAPAGKTHSDSQAAGADKSGQQQSSPPSATEPDDSKSSPKADAPSTEPGGALKPADPGTENQAAKAPPAPAKPQSGDTGGVPRFKLAEQILAEQRRNASERRQRSNAGDGGSRPYMAQDTVGEVIREVKNNLGPAHSAGAKPVPNASTGLTAEDEHMTAVQRQVIEEIVARDIALFSHGVARRPTWPPNSRN